MCSKRGSKKKNETGKTGRCFSIYVFVVLVA
jgi:hypothetical protein